MLNNEENGEWEWDGSKKQETGLSLVVERRETAGVFGGCSGNHTISAPHGRSWAKGVVLVANF